MKGFQRGNPYFSLCGLNCRLCPMHLSGHCGGCGFGNQSCAVARCGLAHGGVEYCWECREYPCARYDRIDEYDSFITHRHQKADMEKMRQIGVDAYNAEQIEKRAILDKLLTEHNDGRRKALYCAAVNLMELEDLRRIMERAGGKTPGEIAEALREQAGDLRLRRKS